MRRCKQCKSPIPPAAKCTDFIGKKGFCSVDCASEWGKQAAITKREREYRKSRAEARDRLKTRSDHAREAQEQINRYVRLRDSGKPCISCGKPDDGSHQRHASHYRSVKACPQLRFNLRNIHTSCMQCNSHLSGNILEYRIRLVEQKGQAFVEWLESQNGSRRYDIEYLKRLKAVFRKRANRLKKRLDTQNAVK